MQTPDIAFHVCPTSKVEARDWVNDQYGRFVGVKFDDDVTLWIEPTEGVAAKDADIIATANLIIGALLEIRDAAVARLNPVPLPDGVEYVGTVGQFLDEIGVPS